MEKPGYVVTLFDRFCRLHGYQYVIGGLTGTSELALLGPESKRNGRVRRFEREFALRLVPEPGCGYKDTAPVVFVRGPKPEVAAQFFRRFKRGSLAYRALADLSRSHALRQGDRISSCSYHVRHWILPTLKMSRCAEGSISVIRASGGTATLEFFFPDGESL